MKFKIDKQVLEKFPNLIIAIPLVYGFDNAVYLEKTIEILRMNESELKECFKLDKLLKDKKIKAYCDLFKKFGVDPEKHVPTHLALAKRVLEGGEIPNINPLVNLYNAMSIKYLTPFGGEDLDNVYGDFVLKFANGGEKWIPIGSKKSKGATKGELVWGDDLDLSTRALNWRQCERTKLTTESKNGYFIMDGFSNINKENIQKAADDFMENAVDMFGGKAEIIWLTKDTPEVEIDFKSKKVEKVKVEKKEKEIKEKKYYGLAKELSDFIKKKQPDFKMPIEHPSIEKFGDFAIRADVDFSDCDLVERTEKVAGFTNIFIKKDRLLREAEKINYELEYKNELANVGKGKKVIVEYSSPNIAKPFGIGHLRSTNIGQALYNIYKVLGWETIGDNHLGDWGTQFGKMMAAYKHWGDKPLEKMTIEDLEKLYVKFHHESETDESLSKEGQAWFAKLEKGDKEAREMWQTCIDISLKEFNRVYEMLGVKIDHAYGESFYEPMLLDIVKELKEKGITKESRGTTIVEFKDLPPAILMKSDGATIYFTRDMATIKYRVNEWHPDLVIYEVGAEQSLYFRQVFEAAEMMGWIEKEKLVHIGHGLIRWKEGKFSTREGKTIHLSEVIDKAMAEAKKIAPDNSKDKIAAVAIGAIKFNDLAQDPKKDIIFDWNRVMSMDGNSGPYLQYTYARCMSVLSKTKIIEQKNIETLPENINVEELGLLREFYKFEEKIIEASERFNPGVVAEYLLTIARKYNEFYGKHRIIDEPEETWRIFLTKVTSNIMKMGLGLLGIETLEKM